jgi:hypothetical protein
MTDYKPKYYIPLLIEAIKQYLSIFQIEQESIPLYVKGYTREPVSVKYPFFYIEQFSLEIDKQQYHADKPLETVEIDDVLYVKPRCIPYRVNFTLEVVDSNPINYNMLTEMLIAKMLREPYITITQEVEIEGEKVEVKEKCPFSVTYNYENEYSEINHRLYNLSVLVQFDPAINLQEAEIIDKLIINDVEIK